MKSFFKLPAILIVISFTFAACNTVRGVGKDIEKGGEAIQKSAN